MTTEPEEASEDPVAGSRVVMYGQAADNSTFKQTGIEVNIRLPTAPEVRYSLPPDAVAFTGRGQELSHITAAVVDAGGSGGVVTVRAIDGMPGVGKTAFAVHAAHVLRDRFPDRQLFIDLHAHTPGREPVRPEDALAGLLTGTGVEPRYLPGDLDGRAAMWRDKVAGQRVLLVLDNAASTSQVAPLLPGGQDCLVLVTSRRHLGDLPGEMTPILLEVLPPDHAQEMFLRLAPRAAPGTAVADLVRLAGFLPLAISLLARVYTRHPSWTLADLGTETEASMLTLAAENDSVAAAFGVSYRHLLPSQQRFFRRLGLHLGTTIDARAAAALADTSLDDAAKSLDALHHEALLTEVTYRRYGMHDLIRRYARDRATADPAGERSQALERLLDFYIYSAAIAESRLARQTRTGPASVLVAPPAAAPDLSDSIKAVSWARTERANLLACLDYATENVQRGRVIAITSAMAALLRQDGPWTDVIARHITAVEAARESADWLAQANALNDLGVVQRLTGDYRGAAQTHETALEIYRELRDRLGQANALNNLGLVRMAEDYQSGVHAQEMALEMYREIGDRLGQANALHQLGEARRLIGDYAGAAEVLEAALDISRDLGDRFGQVNPLIQLGFVRQETGDYAGAVEVLEAALDISRDLDSRLGQVNALTILGAVRQETGDYAGAVEVLEAALDISRNLGSRLGQANALNDLGIVRRETGDYAGAAQALEAALGIYRDLGDRGSQAMALNEAGTLHRVRGHLDKARECHMQALSLARESESSSDEAHALAGLGRCALAAGRIADAKADLRRALDIFHHTGAAEAVKVAAELDNLPD